MSESNLSLQTVVRLERLLGSSFKQQVYICTFCDEYFFVKSDFKEHIINHSQTKKHRHNIFCNGDKQHAENINSHCENSEFPTENCDSHVENCNLQIEKDDFYEENSDVGVAENCLEFEESNSEANDSDIIDIDSDSDKSDSTVDYSCSEFNSSKSNVEKCVENLNLREPDLSLQTFVRLKRLSGTFFKQQAYICTVCDEYFFVESDFKEHINSHSQANKHGHTFNGFCNGDKQHAENINSHGENNEFPTEYCDSHVENYNLQIQKDDFYAKNSDVGAGQNCLDFEKSNLGTNDSDVMDIDSDSDMSDSTVEYSCSEFNSHKLKVGKSVENLKSDFHLQPVVRLQRLPDVDKSDSDFLICDIDIDSDFDMSDSTLDYSCSESNSSESNVEKCVENSNLWDPDLSLQTVVRLERLSGTFKQQAYICTVCDEYFFVKSDFKEHINSHSQAKKHAIAENINSHCESSEFPTENCDSHTENYNLQIEKDDFYVKNSDVGGNQNCLELEKSNSETNDSDVIDIDSDFDKSDSTVDMVDYSSSEFNSSESNVEKSVKNFTLREPNLSIQTVVGLERLSRSFFKQQAYICTFCDEYFFVKSDFEEHMNNHSETEKQRRNVPVLLKLFSLLP